MTPASSWRSCCCGIYEPQRPPGLLLKAAEACWDTFLVSWWVLSPNYLQTVLTSFDGNRRGLYFAFSCEFGQHLGDDHQIISGLWLHHWSPLHRPSICKDLHILWLCFWTWMTDVLLPSFQPLNEGCGGERAAAETPRSSNVDLWVLVPARSAGFYMFLTSGSGAPPHACARRDRRLHVCRQDARINTSGCRLRRQTVCRWRRRQHGPTEAGRLQLWVSSFTLWRPGQTSPPKSADDGISLSVLKTCNK